MMHDPRIDEVANILVNYSTRIRPGELVAITGMPAAEPLLLAIYRQALRAGAHPQILINLPEATELLLREGSDAQLRHISPIADLVVKTFDCRIAILSDENTKALSRIDPARQVLRAQAMRPLNELDMKRLVP